MTEVSFLDQINRLKTRFGAKSFDSELTKLLAKEVAIVPENFFTNVVDTWIGMRKTSNPPLLIDFRECRLSWQKSLLKKEISTANREFNNGLKDVLRREYKVDTLKEAFELEALKVRLGGDNEEKSRSGKD